MDKYTRFSDGARQHLNKVMLIFKPDTVLRWHREIVRRKWTFKRKGKPGRPSISPELEALIVRLAKENSHRGYDKIQVRTAQAWLQTMYIFSTQYPEATSSHTCL
jgi:hypothetical protein